MGFGMYKRFNCAALGVLLVTLSAGPALAGPDLKKAELFDQYAKVEVDDADRLAQARSALSNLLNDPFSAQYRNVGIYTSAWGTVLCGEVNAKNQYGGYGGYRRFVAAGRLAYVEQDGLEFYWFQQANSRFCEGGERITTVRF